VLAINPIIYAEVSIGFVRIEGRDAALATRPTAASRVDQKDQMPLTSMARTYPVLPAPLTYNSFR